MDSNIVHPGDRIEIRILRQVEKCKKVGEQPPVYYSKVQNIQKDGLIEAIMPTENEKNVSFPTGIRFEFVFFTASGIYRCVAYIKDQYVKENIYLILVDPKTPLEKFRRREYYRFECVMDMQYMFITEEEAAMEEISILKEHHKLKYPKDFFKEAVAVELSGGDLRFIAYEATEKGNYLIIILRLENESMDNLLEIVGKVILCQKIKTVSREIKYEYRVNFLFKNQTKRELIIKYIFEQERRSRQKG